MADLVICNKQDLVGIADAIREKKGFSDNINFPYGFTENVNKINTPFPNGTKWEERKGVYPFISTGSNLVDICYANGVYVLGSNSIRGNIKYSFDMKTFYDTNIKSGVFKIMYKDGLWVLVGDAGFFYSTDGITWTQSNVTSADDSFGCAFVNGVYIAGGDYETYYSTDGMSWTKSANSGCLALCEFKGKIIAQLGSTLRYSDDGITWTQSNIARYSYGGSLFKVGKYIYSSNTQNGTYYSTDGINWILNDGIESGTWFKKIVEINGVYVVASSSGIYYSNNGIDWTLSDMTYNISDLAYENGIALALTSTGNIYYSVDGISWVATNMSNKNMSNTKKCIKYVNGVWYTVLDTRIYQSIGWKSEG